ncbi:MAG TPA: hypothetical protein EYO33_30025 [Phycisphaerales bacterium]|nr:hypothetical protein [Phycisphaerales bacterium]
MTSRMIAGTSSRRSERVLSASETNITSDELQTAPGPGVIGVWGASDAVDGLLTARIGSKIPLNRQILPQTSAATVIIETEQTAPLATAVVRGGERITVDYVEVTAAAARVVVIFLGRDLGEG